jgi:tetratricopeptide (TPR) repeat protein
MHNDRRGVAVTTESAAAVSHLDEAIGSFLGHRADACVHLDRALSADPGLALGHCLYGFAKMLLGRGELVDAARRHAAKMRASLALRGGTAREERLCRALAHWLDGDMEASAATLEQALVAEPLDALSFKLAHQLRFMLGDAVGMRLAAEKVLPHWRADVPDRGFILGCHAFALEETDALAEAERAGREALEIAPLDAWGCHAVAHVFEAKCRPADGLAWLAGHERRLSGLNNFAMHLAWHAALFHLARHDSDAALDLYDRKIRAQKTDDFRDIANAASLLWRLEIEGVAVGRRWEELADIAERRIGDGSLVFAQLHYMMCLLGSGRRTAASDMLAAMRRRAGEETGTQARVLAHVGLPMAKALFCFASGDAHRAVALAGPLRDNLRHIGGSLAQRDIFERTLIASTVAARRVDEGRALLEERLKCRPNESWAGDQLARLGAA